jgi:hypothetical protein
MRSMPLCFNPAQGLKPCEEKGATRAGKGAYIGRLKEKIEQTMRRHEERLKDWTFHLMRSSIFSDDSYHIPISWSQK